MLSRAPDRVLLKRVNVDGAGVDIFESDFWIKALPRQQRSWVIAPTGRTAWVRLSPRIHT